MLSTILALSLLVATLGGCSSASQSTGSSAHSGVDNGASGSNEAKTTLQFYDWTDEKDYMQKIVDQFNAQSKDTVVKLDLISDSNNEYSNKLLVMLTGGADLDLYAVNGLSKLSLYTSKNVLLDLSKQVTSSGINLAAYGPSFQDTLTLEKGKYFALPYRSSAYALFYNKDVFDKDGIPYPTQMTWDQYAQLAKKMTKQVGSDTQWGGYVPDWEGNCFSTLQKGSNILDDNLNSTKEWLECLNKLYNVDKSHMSYKEMKAEKVDWLSEFESGKVAMMPNGDWTINEIKADISAGKCKINFDMAPLPLPDGITSPITPGGDNTFVGIYSKSQKADAAFEFIKYLCGEKGGSIIAGNGVLPAYINDGTKQAFLNATGLAGSGYFFNAKTVSENPPVSQIDAVNKAFQEQKDLYLLGQQDIDKTINNFEQQRKSILAKK